MAYNTKYIYIKSTTVYVPIVGIGTLPTPLSPASVPLLSEPKGGGHTRLQVRGWGSPSSHDCTGEKAYHSAYSVAYSMCQKTSRIDQNLIGAAIILPKLSKVIYTRPTLLKILKGMLKDRVLQQKNQPLKYMGITRQLGKVMIFACCKRGLIKDEIGKKRP